MTMIEVIWQERLDRLRRYGFNTDADEIERLQMLLAEAERDAARYREWRRAFRDGECGLYNALCDAGSEAEHDAAIDEAMQETEDGIR